MQAAETTAGPCATCSHDEADLIEHFNETRGSIVKALLCLRARRAKRTSLLDIGLSELNNRDEQDLLRSIA